MSRLDTGSALSVWGSFLDKQYETGSSIPLRPDGTFVNVNGGREAFYGSKDTSSARRMAWTAARLEHTVTPRVSLQSTLHYRRTKSHADLDFYDHFGFQPERNVMTVNGFDAEVTGAAMYTEGVATITLPTARVLIGGNFERTAIDEIDRWSGQYGFTFACGFTFFAIEIDYTTGAVLNCNHPCFEQDAVRTIADTTNRFGSVFAQADLELGARATVTLGGRYDRFNRRSEITAGDPLVPGRRSSARSTSSIRRPPSRSTSVHHKRRAPPSDRDSIRTSDRPGSGTPRDTSGARSRRRCAITRRASKDRSAARGCPTRCRRFASISAIG